MNRRPGSGLLLVIVAVGLLGLASCKTGPITGGKSTVINPRTGTVVDGWGNAAVSTRPANCLATAEPFPGPVDQWWLMISPSVREVAPVTGYRAWANPTPPAGCPRDFRTEVYRGFYEFDVTPFLGRSGAVVRAVARIKVRATNVTPTFIPVPPQPPTEAFLCDNATAGAFQLRRVPPAVAFNDGFDLRDGVDTAAPARIPNAFPVGTNVFDFPTKTPSSAGTGSTARQYDVDVTSIVVSTLQAFEALNTSPPAPARFARIVFMMTGTNEPPALKNGPLPFSDCRGAYSVELDIQEP